MYQIANTVPPDVRTLRPDLPAELAALLQALLAKRAEDRPGSGADVAAALRRIAPAVSDSTFDQTQALRTSHDDRITPTIPV
jgi:serine/threonine-protein kinase